MRTSSTISSDSVVAALLEDDFDIDKSDLSSASPIPAKGVAYTIADRDYKVLADFDFPDIGPLVDTMSPIWQMLTRQKEGKQAVLHVVGDRSANESTLSVSKFRAFMAGEGQLSSGLDDVLQGVEQTGTPEAAQLVMLGLFFDKDLIVQTGQFP